MYLSQYLAQKSQKHHNNGDGNTIYNTVYDYNIVCSSV